MRARRLRLLILSGHGLISAALMVVGIGFLMLLALAIWLIVRCVKGFQWLQNNQAPPDVETWWV